MQLNSSRVQRQRYSKCGAFSGLADIFNRPSMFAYDLLHNGKSQTGTVGFCSFEQLKDIDSIGYTNPGVADFQNHLII